MLKKVCSGSFLDTSYFANSLNTECTQGLGIFFLWHFSAILIWMESCRSAIVESRDTRMRAGTPGWNLPPRPWNLHAPLPPNPATPSPPFATSTLQEYCTPSWIKRWQRWDELNCFFSGKSFGCHFFWWCFCWCCMPPLEKSYAEYRYFVTRLLAKPRRTTIQHFTRINR